MDISLESFKMMNTKKQIIVLLHVVILLIACVLPAAAMQGNRADEMLSFANQLKKDRLFEAAAQQFLEFATGNPTDPRAPDALEQAADCLSKGGSDDEAIRVLETLIRTYETSVDLCRPKVRLARLYFNKDRYDDADRTFSEVIALSPDCPLYADALLGKGETLIPLRKYNEAADLFSAIIQNHSNHQAAPRAYYDLAFCYRRLDKKEEALQAYSQLIQAFPKDPLSAFAAIEAGRMHAARGDSLFAVESYKSARKFTEKAIFIPATMEGAAILLARGDHTQALGWYREILAFDDFGGVEAEPAEIYGSAAHAAYKAGSYDLIYQFSNQFAERYEGVFSPKITYYVALGELKRADFTRAIEHAGYLERYAPGSEWAQHAPRIRGEALAASGKPREAVGEFRRFVAATADSSAKCDALRNIADIFMTAIGDTSSALDAMQQRLEVQNRRFPQDILRTGRAFENARHYTEAARLYLEITVGFPISSEAAEAESRLSFIREFTLLDPVGALTDLFDVSLALTSMEQNAARLELAEARLEILKDSQGALDMLSDIKAALRGSDLYAKALYLEGACYGKRHQKAALLNQESAAADAMQRSSASWDELARSYPASEWTARAAVDRILLGVAMGGAADTAAVYQTLARYPQNPARGSLLVLLGDYFSNRGSKGDSRRALVYYQQAVNLAGADRSMELELKVAEAMSGEGRHEEALQIYNKFINHEETRIRLRATYGAGKSLRELERYEDALAKFLDVGRLAGGNLVARALLQAADCSYMLGRFDDALATYRQVRTATNDADIRWRAMFNIGLCHKRMDRTNEALQIMENCISSSGGGQLRERAYTLAMELAGDIGDRDKERQLLASFSREFRTGNAAITARRRLVRLHLDVEDPGQAVVLSQELMSASAPPADEDIALYAMSLYRAGRGAEAKAQRDIVEQKLGATHPLTREIAIEQAKYHYGKEDYKSAADAVAPLAQQCAGDSICEEGIYIYSMSLIALDQVEQGTREAQRFFEKYPLSRFVPRLHLSLGNVLVVKYKRHNEALTHFREASVTAKDSSVVFDALKHMAITFQTLSRWTEAGDVWGEVLARFPESGYAKEASLNAARCKMESGDYAGAIGSYQAAIPILEGEDRARAYYWTGVCHQNLGDFQSAIVEFLKVPYLTPGQGMWGVTSQLKAAECYMAIQRYESARNIYSSVVQRYGAGSNWGKVAQKALTDIDNIEQKSNKSGGGEG
ncbi:MAG: tetratricopeptide repeat protein [Candidatus Latescibacterota bacterium]